MFARSDIEQANIELEKLITKPKYIQMITTAAILTDLLEEKDIKPIIVGGLSVEIYTQQDYTTRDIDFVLNGYDVASTLLELLGFKKEGKDFYRFDIKVAVEIPGSHLEGDYNRVKTIKTEDDRKVYVISIEDIIMDRLRAAVHWKSGEDRKWGFRLLLFNYKELDLEYMKTKIVQHPLELKELTSWIEQAEGAYTDKNE